MLFSFHKMMWHAMLLVLVSNTYSMCMYSGSYHLPPRQLAQQALARLRGRRLQAFLQELGAVARGEHTVDMLQTYAEWEKKRSWKSLLVTPIDKVALSGHVRSWRVIRGAVRHQQSCPVMSCTFPSVASTATTSLIHSTFLWHVLRR